MSRQPRVFISRTTAGLAALAERIADVLRRRGIEPIIQSAFYPSTHDVKGMLAEHLQQCDAVICLIGSAYGAGPRDPITKVEQPVHGLKDPRTKNRFFSYTQLELLIARDLGRPIYTFFIDGDELPTVFAYEAPELAQRQQVFISEFAKDTRNTYGAFSQWDQPADPPRGLKQTIEALKFEVTVLAGKPTNLPYTSLGPLFKGRDDFLAELRQHLTAEGPVVIKGKRTIHGMGGVGKTRAAIEYAWKHANDYHALLFISADTSEALHRNLASLCGPLVLNLPEQNEKEQHLQVHAALRWLKLKRDWLLIIDNVDTDEAAEETKALLAKLTTGHVLITSRISDWTGDVKSLDLDVLSEAASIAFLDERTEERRPKKDDDREKVTALVKLLDRLALALEQAGAHISTSAISYADYIGLWEAHCPDALAWHDHEKMKYPKSLAVTYETSVTQLSDGAKHLFHILSWFAPDPIPRSLLESSKNPLSEKRHLSEIEHLHLVRYLGDGNSFVIHRLNQDITRSQQSKTFASPELLTAIKWVAIPFQVDPDDATNWGILNPLAPHAHSLAMFADKFSACSEAIFLMNRLSALLCAKAEFTSAEHLMRRALAIEEQQPAGKLLRNSLLNNLATLLSETGRFKEAETIFHRSIQLLKDCFEDDRLELLAPLNGLAIVLMETNQLVEAERILLDCLAIAKMHFGENSPRYALILGNLSEALQKMNRLTDAIHCARQALAIQEAFHCEDHPAIAVCLNNLAGLYTKANLLQESEPLLLRAIAIDEHHYGPTHPNVTRDLNNLSQVFKRSGRHQEAEVVMRRILQADQDLFGETHHLVANRMNNLATLLAATDRPKEAELLMRRALKITEEQLGEAHPTTAVRLNNLAHLLLALGNTHDAEIMMRRHVVIFLKFTVEIGRPHEHLGKAINNYASIIENLHPPEQVTQLIDTLADECGLPRGDFENLLMYLFDQN